MTSTPRPGALPPCPEGGVRQELLDDALQFMEEYSDAFQALADTPCVPPAPEPIDYTHAFKVWWHQAINPAVPPSRTAAETHVLFAQHMVLVELGRVERGEVGR